MTMLAGPELPQPHRGVDPAAVDGALVPSGGVVLGIDIGGTKTAAMVVDSADEVLGRAERPTDRHAPLLVAVEVARAALVAAGAADGSLRAVGVAVPGDVDARTGIVRLAVNLEAQDLPLGALLAEMLGAPCYVEHDARAAATWLAARPGATGDLAYLSIGTGIAAGVVLDGLPLAGDNGLAGEIGHCIADPDGPLCPCGLRGCLEAVASGPAVARAAQAAIDVGEPSLLRDRPADTVITADAVYAAAARGDLLALQVISAAAEAI
ncbi:MAG: ROK family protein, partial [Chloroflexi bacterium]|nr:ROK family protein [Chloroflexota bacterium]